MKDIIIVGTGKAALLHYNSYKKLKKIGNVYFVDIKSENKYIENIEIYPSIIDCIDENKLNKKNLIIDICTPKSEFINILKICKKEQLYNVLVEKPFVMCEKQFDEFKLMNVVMVENYLYSKVTKWIKKYLNHNKKDIRLIFTNFSKNRMPDSSSGRGFINKATLNYEIEMPHQIYLTQFFLNSQDNVENSITCSRDMRIGDMNLKNHGYGLIISKYKDIDIIYESNLTSTITQKRIIIVTTDNYAIEGNYALYTDDLKILKKANINIYYNGKLIEKHIIPIDDSFTYFIKEAYEYFHNGKCNPNLVSINDFSELMNIYCTNLLDRKIKENNN